MVRAKNLTQIINRTRGDSNEKGNFEGLKDIVIPENLKYTLESNQLFLWDDRGANDLNRVLMFSCDKNIEILNENKIRFVDGTFDIAPAEFKQVLTINVVWC